MSLETFLSRSCASDGFRAEVAEFLRTGRSSQRIAFGTGAPPLKVERTLTRLLEALPDLEIDRVEIRGRSGCEHFRGELIVFAGETSLRILFHWDCRWRALEQGWTDYFGFPDQARAAREFGYDCFRTWEPVEEPAAEPAGR